MLILKKIKLSLILFLFLAAAAFPKSVHAENQGPQKMSSQEIINSGAAQLFRQGDYEEALKAFTHLSEKHPGDLTLQRYIALCHALLGDSNKAADILEEALSKEPERPALHFHLAWVHYSNQRFKQARHHLKKVLELAPEGYYARRSRRALKLIAKNKFSDYLITPWSFSGSTGYEYDSNVILLPNDKSLTRSRDANAGRYYTNLSFNYRLMHKGRFDSWLGYRFYQSIHDDNLDAFNFSYHRFSWINQYRTKIKDRPVKWRLRYSTPFGFLDGDTFSYANQIAPSVTVGFTQNSRTEFYYEYSNYQFGPDGIAENITSRDGHYHEAGIEHRIYFDGFSSYFLMGYEFQKENTTGDNFDAAGHRFRTGVVKKLTKRLDATVIGSFLTKNHTHYNAVLAPSEDKARRDHNWILYSALGYTFNNHWRLEVYYRYENANNQNDLFQYDRHIAGTAVKFKL